MSHGINSSNRTGNESHRSIKLNEKSKNVALSSGNLLKKNDLSVTAIGLTSSRSNKSVENIFLPNGVPRSAQSTARSIKSNVSSVTNVSSLPGAADGDALSKNTNRTFVKTSSRIGASAVAGGGGGGGRTGSRLSAVSSSNSTRIKSRGAELDTFLDLNQLQSSEDLHNIDEGTSGPEGDIQTVDSSINKWIEGLNRQTTNNSRSNWQEIAIASNQNSPTSNRGHSFPLGLYTSQTSIQGKWTKSHDEPSEIKVLDRDDDDDDVGSDEFDHEMTHDEITPRAANQLSSTVVNKEKIMNSLREERAAHKIQVWYRRHVKRHRSAQAAMRRLMTTKKRELTSTQQSIDKNYSLDQAKKKEQRKQQERQKAIEELQRRREEKRILDKQIAESEVKKLKEEGKIATNNSSGKKSSRSKTSNPQQPTSARSSSSRLTTTTTTTTTPRNIPSPSPSITNIVEPPSPQSQPQFQADRLKSLFSPDRVTVSPRIELPTTALSTCRTEDSRQSKTTLDDILSTLRELEQVDHRRQQVDNLFSNEAEPQSRGSRKSAWMADIDKLLSDGNQSLNSTNELTIESLRQHDERMKISAIGLADSFSSHKDKDNFGVNQQQQHQRLGDIAAFIQGSERFGDVSVATSASDKINSYQAELDSVELARLGHEMEKNSRAAVEEVSSHVFSQKLELEERRRTVSMLQKALQQQRELTLRQVHETQQDWERRMEVLQREHQSTVERNYALIDQLIDEKKILQEKCDGLVNEVKNLRQKTEEKLRQMEEKHVLEMKKIEAKHAAAEKLRREKWESDKTRLIKEMTVKGMEAEIAQLIAGHKAELRKQKQQMEEAVLQADQRAYQNYGRQVDELRQQLTREKEEAIQKEREMAKIRYESQLETETAALEAQRRRLYTEVQDEKERLAHLGAKQKSEQEQMKREAEEYQQKTLDSWRREYERSRDEQEMKHKAEVEELKLKLQVEKDSWQQNFLKDQETQLMMKERELRANLRKERDREIDMVLERLEMDSTTAKEECERAADNKIKRIRDKYEAEMQELERSERAALEKYNQMKANLLEVQGENDRLKVLLKQKEQEIEDVRKLYEKLNREREFASDIIRQEFADRLVATDEENKRFKNEMSELRARLGQEAERSREEIKRMELEKEDELEKLHKRVKEALLKKEENINELRRQFQLEIEGWKGKLATAVKRSEHLEGLLEQQRQQLLALKR